MEKVFDSKFLTSNLSGSSLKRYSNISIGSKATYLFAPHTVSELAEIIRTAVQNNLEVVPIGGCSNILFGNVGNRVIISDENLPKICEINGNLAHVSCNYKISTFIEEMKKHDLGGLEFLAGIPAHLGGTVHMNAGAFDKCLSSYVEFIEVIDRKSNLKKIPFNEVECQYRHISVQDFILNVGLRLESKSAQEISSEIGRIMALRKERHPYDFPSLGSTFKNPDGYFAGILIRDCGLAGKRIGDAQISEKHSNFFLNLGQATFQDYKALIALAQKEVFEQKGIKLELEVKVLN
ncbi:MAG: UDP-N-acetylmuramate dehydrogenase [Candidatus Cloacimonadales bacterium]|nr:UDP-N-acetylmuramate dehydrogenase [Candidatus Cloacimonadales bacterium]